MNKEIKIDLGKIFNSIVQKWWVILCSVALFLAVTSIYSEVSIKKEYSATATVYSMSYGSLTDSLTGASALSAYVDLVTSRKVAEGALSYLSGEYGYSVDQIQEMITTSTTASNGSKLSEKIYITSTATNPDHAIAIANAVTNAFVDEMQSLTGGNTVQVLDSANYAGWSNENSKLVVRLLGVFIGVLIPVMIIFFKEILSDEVYHIEDASCDGELEVLAVIPDFDNK